MINDLYPYYCFSHTVLLCINIQHKLDYDKRSGLLGKHPPPDDCIASHPHLGM